MDIVIPYKKNTSGELEWALKSLQNIDGYERVIVLDDSVTLPDWGHKNMYANQIAKYLYVCTTEGISDSILASNDDVFILRKWKPVNYNRGSLESHIAGRRIRDAYTRSLVATKAWLEQNGLPTLSFELHTPFLYDKNKLKAIIELMPKDIPLQLRSIYGNYYGIQTEFMEDCKNIKDYEGKIILSTNESTFRGELGEYIRSKL